MPELCNCDDCQIAARRMRYISQLIDFSHPHIFTAHSKLIVHFNEDDPRGVQVEDGHSAQKDLLRIFRLVEDMHIYSREVRSINWAHQKKE